MTTDSNTYLTILHGLLNQHFNLAEIQTLCFNLNVDYESISGEEKPSRIRELLLALGRDGRLSELITLAQQYRPHVVWPPVPNDFQLPESLASGNIGPPDQYHIYGDVVQGDKISVGNIEWSIAAVDAGVVVVASRGVYVSGNVYGNIHTGDNIFVSTTNYLTTYIDNKLNKWAKSETTTHYIPLTARVSPHSLKQEIENKSVSWCSIPDIEEALETFNGCFVLLGDPGSGKSTLLRRFAYQAALNYKKTSDAHLPVLLKLSQWPESVEFEKFLEEELYRETGYRKPVSGNKLFLLLDGLNEMAGDIEVKRKSIVAFLEEQNVDSRSNGGIRVIASCRYHSYTATVALDLPQVVVEPLTTDQIHDYLQIQGIESVKLFDDITLAKQPFYLAILIEEYKASKLDLNDPSYRNRARLLEKFIERLWEQERTRQDRPYANQVPEFAFVKPALEQLGFDIQVRDKGTSIPARLALQSFLEALGLPGKPSGKMRASSSKANRQIAKDQQNAEFLMRVCENSGILRIGQDGTQVEFDHELLHEFFAACHLYTGWRQDHTSVYQYIEPTILSHNERYREQQHWDEVWFILANLCNVIELDNLIGEISYRDPFFAAEIASRTNPSSGCLYPLITTLIQYANGERKCGKRVVNCQETAIYALGNFAHTSAIINAIVRSLDDRNLYRVSRAVLWQIGQRIGIPSLLQYMQDGRREGDNTIWGLFIHGFPGGEYYTKFALYINIT